jgi:hypothetical protein
VGAGGTGVHGSRHTPCHATKNDQGASCDKATSPGEAGIRAHRQRVRNSSGPAQVGRPVHGAPDPRRQPGAQGARYAHGQQHICAHGADGNAGPLVRRRQGHYDSGPADIDVRVEQGRDHVHGQKCNSDRRDVTVGVGPDEGRQLALGPSRYQHPEEGSCSQQDQGHYPGSAAQVPKIDLLHQLAPDTVLAGEVVAVGATVVVLTIVVLTLVVLDVLVGVVEEVLVGVVEEVLVDAFVGRTALEVGRAVVAAVVALVAVAVFAVVAVEALDPWSSAAAI